jgi:predicted GIY-YIG superfamily endonuclease
MRSHPKTEHTAAHTALYRLYDDSDALLYIGIAGNPGRRFEQHRRDKPWWGQVARITLEHHPTRDKALTAETEAIRTEHPRYNIAGTTNPPRNSSGRIPDWQHRPLTNGAYLDIENRGDHIYAGINRDDLATDLHHRGQNWLTPIAVLETTDFLNQLCIYWLWADGCQRETFTGSSNSRYRGIHVRPRYLAAASQALIASELKGDLTPTRRLITQLQRSFPKNQRATDLFLDHMERLHLIEAGPEAAALIGAAR